MALPSVKPNAVKTLMLTASTASKRKTAHRKTRRNARKYRRCGGFRRFAIGGDNWNRTSDLLHVKQAL